MPVLLALRRLSRRVTLSSQLHSKMARKCSVPIPGIQDINHNPLLIDCREGKIIHF